MSYYLYIQESERGPYGEAELRDMLAHREVNGNVPARRADESEWSTVEACLAAQKTTVAAVAAAPASRPSPIPARFSGPVAETTPREEPRAVTSSPVTPNAYYSSHHTSMSKVSERAAFAVENEKHPGIGRVMYFFAMIGLSFLARGLQFVVDDNVTVLLVCAAICILGEVALLYLRVQNIGWSAKWCLAPLAMILFPFMGELAFKATKGALTVMIMAVFAGVVGMNFYLGVMCLAAPPGYGQTKKFDLGGKIVLWVILTLVILMVLSIVAAIFIPGVTEIVRQARAAAKASR